MSKLIENIINEAKKINKKIVLPESDDKRILDAACYLVENKIAQITLVGDRRIIEKSIGQSVNLMNIINPKIYNRSEEFAQKLYELRKEKGMTIEKARDLILNNSLYFSAMLLKEGIVDGMVGGACHSTGDLLRPALQIIKTKKGIKTVSSIFLMDMENTLFKNEKVMVFGDCAVNIDPTADQLKDIAISSYESAKAIANIQSPKVAMLSFSTKGSAKHPNVDKVMQAVEKVKEIRDDILIDGEIQVDAALVEEVQKLKAPNSSIKGKANVMIFPDLQSGNIGYKLVQRLAGATALGPICQGFLKPVNDLSRGCNSDDVVCVVAITAIQSTIN